jgi:hypothetical protein
MLLVFVVPRHSRTDLQARRVETNRASGLQGGRGHKRQGEPEMFPVVGPLDEPTDR